MEVIEPLPNSTYKVHLRYQSFMGEVLYLKVDNMTNKVFLDKVRCYTACMQSRYRIQPTDIATCLDIYAISLWDVWVGCMIRCM